MGARNRSIGMSDNSGPEVTRRQYLQELYAPKVRRERHFEVNLRDTTTQVPRDPPEPFFRRYDRVIRPLLEIAESCRLFRFEQEGRLEQMPGLAGIWARDGVTLEQVEAWRAGYVVRVDGEPCIDLRPEVLDDRLFWWWVYPAGGDLRPVLVTSLGKFDAAGYFARTHYPRAVGRMFQDSFRSAFAYAKGETTRRKHVAFLLSAQMRLSVIASAARLVELFELALAHARLRVEDVPPEER